MDECTEGVEEYERYSLCDYAGSYDSYTESFTYYGSADEETVYADTGEEIGSSAEVVVTDSGLPPTEITITSPTYEEEVGRLMDCIRNSDNAIGVYNYSIKRSEVLSKQMDDVAHLFGGNAVLKLNL